MSVQCGKTENNRWIFSSEKWTPEDWVTGGVAGQELMEVS